jgi:ABC-type transport system involved in cytochrome c biogenesis permease subunit
MATIAPLASLKLTVVLFTLSVLLVFFGTLAQMTAGVWTVVDKYFYSLVVKVDFQLFVLLGQKFFNLPLSWRVDGWFPFPGGKLLGWALFVNLLVAHLTRFRLLGGYRQVAQVFRKHGNTGAAWKKLIEVMCKVGGLYLLHGGLLLLLIGEYVTREYQVEQRMVISEGERACYAFDTRNTELAFVTPAGKDHETATVVPASRLQAALEKGQPISHPHLPVTLEVLAWMPNARMVEWEKASDELKATNLGTAGFAKKLVLERRDEVNGTDPNQLVDYPAAYIRLRSKDGGEDLGVYAFQTLMMKDQTVKVNGQEYTMALRFTRHYKPFQLELIKFTHERYLGTNLPKNFSSRLRIIDPDRGEDREVDVSMNEPLRYRGEAFFQSGFDEETEKTTILQVVRNPGWLIPYISCVMVMVGMVVYFCVFLVQFLGRTVGSIPSAPVVQANQAAAPPHKVWRFLSWGLAGLATLYLLSNTVPRSSGNKFDFEDAGKIAVVGEGRVKPLDTVVRVAMRRLNKREDFVDQNDHSQPALKWFFDVASASQDHPGSEIKHVMFRIENLELLALLGLERRSGYRYSLEEFMKKLPELRAAASKARKVPEKDQTPFENKTLELDANLKLYESVWQGSYPLVLPPNETDQWRSPAEAELRLKQRVEAVQRAVLAEIIQDLPKDQRDTPDKIKAILAAQPPEVRDRVLQSVDAAYQSDPASNAWDEILSAYRSGSPDKFRKAVAEYRALTEPNLSRKERFQVSFEHFLNRFAPYYHCTFLYGVALALALVSWLLWMANPTVSAALRRSAFAVLMITFAVHTFSLFARMYLMERPLVFVTNLYSSAVFIGWTAAGVCLILERLFPIGLGNMVASALGLGTCVVAHNLAVGGDTLEMMRAVLDTNFWLATHVTTVTFGYAATYVAGKIGLIYLILGIFTRWLNEQVSTRTGRSMSVNQILNKMMYGVICVATLFSFVGTVLGGIWADQSWGRFWGWDPKENGAVLIVVWNALILHARWAGLIKTRGMAVLTLVGNMITTWSWFGTNQLGVGLHAYGFNNTLAMLCVGVWSSHIIMVAIGALLPRRYWLSDPDRLA